jgi:hypothetical protein
VIVQPTGETGRATLRAIGDGLAAGELAIDVTAR